METIGSCSNIPKIIHQIWLGPYDPPLKWMKNWMDFCQKYNWEYRLYRDSDIEQFGLINKEIYDKSSSYQKKADIARYEIIYKYGGLYIDCDMIWLGKNISKYLPLDKNMFIGIQEFPSIHDIGNHKLCNGMFAAPPRHSILKRCIEKIPEYDSSIIKKIYGPWTITGPVLLNDCIKEPIIVVPYHYIFPVDFHSKQDIKDPCAFKEDALVYTYNGDDYPHKPATFIWVYCILVLLIIVAIVGYKHLKK